MLLGFEAPENAVIEAIIFGSTWLLNHIIKYAKLNKSHPISNQMDRMMTANFVCWGINNGKWSKNYEHFILYFFD